jgi:hypothetical protein
VTADEQNSIACTLSGEAQQDRLAWIAALVRDALRGSERDDLMSRFLFKDADGKTDSAEIITKYAPKRIVHPVAKADPSISPRLMRAATIAEERANAHSREQCWHYVKQALVASGAVNSYPKTVNAKDAAKELVSSYGFKKLPVRDPYKAPVGSVLVYNAKNGAGHVEIRTKNGFASDFRSKIPSPRPLIGVYTKL